MSVGKAKLKARKKALGTYYKAYAGPLKGKNLPARNEQKRESRQRKKLAKWSG